MAKNCDHLGCSNGAYYEFLGHHRCGVHSRLSQLKEETTCSLCSSTAIGRYQGQPYCSQCGGRKKLPKQRENVLAIQEERDKKIEEAAMRNQLAGRRGDVIVSKMRMMKRVDHREGYRSVFPNRQHGGRTDGLGVPSLSPMVLGPVHHPQPNLPVANNLENLHQFNKVFPSEVDKDNNPLPQFYETQRKAYEDDIPHRHKESATGNIPLYSIWRNEDGGETRLSYFESRQVYCHYYEKLAKQTDVFYDLCEMLAKGYNLNIIGYDGYPVEQQPREEHYQCLERCYRDISRPFGHELVLYTLLTETEEHYPWRRYTTLKL